MARISPTLTDPFEEGPSRYRYGSAFYPSIPLHRLPLPVGSTLPAVISILPLPLRLLISVSCSRDNSTDQSFKDQRLCSSICERKRNRLCLGERALYKGEL